MSVESKKTSLALEEALIKGSTRKREERHAAVEPQQQRALASSVDLSSLETPGRSPHLDPKGWFTWTHGTGAAISAFPLDAKIRTETESTLCSNKTASRELISDRGGLRVQGTTEYGYGVTSKGGGQISTKL